MLEKYEPKIGDFVHPDEWDLGENLKAADGYRNSSFPGCQFRLPSRGEDLAVNITVTGKPRFRKNSGSRLFWRSRVKIEFVGDGEPSTFSGGWIYH